MSAIEGRVWRFGDHVDTDQIIPAERLTSDNMDRLDAYVFEKVRPGLSARIRQGDVVVAGRNFGCGSSREHAPRALKQAGVSCVVAESFARIFFRNSINVGLIPVECRIDAAEGETISVDLSSGTIVSKDSGKRWAFSRYPDFIQDLIRSGGLMAKVKERGRCSR